MGNGWSLAISGFDPSRYKEHQVVNSAVNSTSLTTLMSYTGNGLLEGVIIGCGFGWVSNSHTISPVSTGITTTTPIELCITIDGIVVLDILESSAGSSDTSEISVVLSKDIIEYNYTTGALEQVAGFESLAGGLITVSTGVLPAPTFTFPNAAQQSLAKNSAALESLDYPIYFNQSLLVQVKGAASSGAIQAYAKARY
jgi:hypothetical protein